MLKVFKKENRLLLHYQSELDEADWIDAELQDEGIVSIKRIFSFRSKHIIDANDAKESDNESRIFVLGFLIEDYYKIDKDILGLQFDLLLYKNMKINDKTFIAAGRISIFNKIDRLIKEQIVVGGDYKNAIPVSDFEKLLQVFPTKSTLDHFANSRISGILKEYLGTITDAQKKLEDHLKRQGAIKAKSRVKFIQKYEVEKYKYIRDVLKEMLLESDSYTEVNWQKLIVDFLFMIFPKYVAVLEKVQIKDYYTKPNKTTNRYIDLTLVDANGNIDIIEIKKPFTNCLLSSSTYRDNYTPKKDLSGSVMQVEKYLFHLNKWGAEGEKRINEKYSKQLPHGMVIKITNPKAMIVLGRENDFAKEQKFDFEIIKRKYANIVDIMTYDDLLHRLENIISRFEVAP